MIFKVLLLSDMDPHLLFGDVDRLVQDDPYRALPAARMSGGSLVRHVLLGVRQQRPQRDVPNWRGRTCQMFRL